MKPLPIKRILTEDNRLQSIHFHGNVYDLYRGQGDDKINYYVTEHGDPEQIFMAITRELWEQIFEWNSR